MAGKQRFSTQQVINALRSARGIQYGAALILKCTRQTVSNYIDRYPTVKQVYDEERESMIDIAESRLLDSVIRGDAWAIGFTLRTLGRDRGYVVRQETTSLTSEEGLASLLHQARNGSVNGVTPDDE